MAGRIFINYRRDDSAPWAGRLYERLARDFKRGELFMDVDHIEPGLDFTKVLDEQVGACDVFLAIIGKNWSQATDTQGALRLSDPDDFVRIEIEAALRRDIRVIPVLVDGAAMPKLHELPETMQSLARRNAVQLTHERFGSDVVMLVETLKRAFPSRNGWFKWKGEGSAASAARDQPRIPLQPATPEKKSSPAYQTPPATVSIATNLVPSAQDRRFVLTGAGSGIASGLLCSVVQLPQSASSNAFLSATSSIFFLNPGTLIMGAYFGAVVAGIVWFALKPSLWKLSIPFLATNWAWGLALKTHGWLGSLGEVMTFLGAGAVGACLTYLGAALIAPKLLISWSFALTVVIGSIASMAFYLGSTFALFCIWQSLVAGSIAYGLVNVRQQEA